MSEENRIMIYDGRLRVGAYGFERLTRGFPAHFHEHYTIGYVKSGARRLVCGSGEYALRGGDITIFNPREIHACLEEEALDFRGINVPAETMSEIYGAVAGESLAPRFGKNVVRSEKAAALFVSLHENIMNGESRRGAETLRLMISELIECAAPRAESEAERGVNVAEVCEYIGRNYAERITLEQLCRRAGASKSTLLRAFVRETGATPYGYLENVRICEAKRLLESGVPPAEVALSTGFYDQSHLTAYFTRFIGLTPREYQRAYKGKGSGEYEKQ